MPFDDFHEVTKLADAFHRAQVVHHLNLDRGGVNAGQITRVHHDDVKLTPEDKKAEKRFADLIFEITLQALLDDPVYKKRWEEFGDFLTLVETQTDNWIATVRAGLADIRAKLDDMRENANRLPDGTRVYKFSDGRVIDADGNPVRAEVASGLVWTDRMPKAEEYVDALAREQDAVTLLQDLESHRTDLGDTRNEYENEKPPISIERMDDLEMRHKERMKDFDLRVTEPSHDESPELTTKIPVGKITL